MAQDCSPDVTFQLDLTFWKPKWYNGVQTAKCIMESEVWALDSTMQTLGHLNSRNIDTWMEKPLSAGCVNTVLAC